MGLNRTGEISKVGKFLRTLQYIPHHNPPCHIGICRWLHFASGLDLCLWESWSISWGPESSRTFGERFKEHLKPPSPIYDHSNITGHNVTINNFNIVGREDINQMRTIKGALYIRVNDPSLNRNVAKYHLPHVWDVVLSNTSELKLK